MIPISENLSLADRLRQSFRDREYANTYARGFLNSYIATQIKVLREQRGWTQEQLADETGMKQPRIALLEDVDYSSWSVSTLWRLAQALHVRLKISFEEFGSLPQEIGGFNRECLQRRPLEEDPIITGTAEKLPKNVFTYSYANIGAEASFMGTAVACAKANAQICFGAIPESLMHSYTYTAWLSPVPNQYFSATPAISITTKAQNPSASGSHPVFPENKAA